jgi:SAM-dependent methyltransferase
MSNHKSETSKHRDKFLPYLPATNLLDIGFGGDPIAAHAVRCDFGGAYPGTVGDQTTQLDFDARSLPFKDATLDAIYASHYLEDATYAEQVLILKEWKRCLSSGGKILLLVPDQQRFEAHCAATGQPLNGNHKNTDYSLATFKSKVWPQIRGDMVWIEGRDLEDYSFMVVIQKL